MKIEKIIILFVAVPILSGLFISTPLWADYVPGEVLLKFKPAIGRTIAKGPPDKIKEKLNSRVSALNTRRGVAAALEKKWIKMLGVAKLKFSPDKDILEIIEKYIADGEVEYAHPNYIRRVFIPVPNDTKYKDQWGLKKIMANYAWEIERGDTTIVAVLDTGVDTDHEDLQAKLVAGYDYANGDNDPDDDHGHGTHVAGIIGAITNNTAGVAGVSWNCRIMPVKVMGADGVGDEAKLAQGIHYAAQNGAKVINMSLGGTDPVSATLADALHAARHDSDCVLIAAAGNDGTQIENYPAADTRCIAVGATNEGDGKASFSNYGSWIDVCAPGTEIWSTMPNHWVTMNGQGYSQNYGRLQGTSMATPFVSGVAALVLSRFQTLSNTEVEIVIRKSVDDLGVSGKDVYYGYGRINALKAIGIEGYATTIDPIRIYTYPNPLRIPQSTTIIIKDIPIL